MNEFSNPTEYPIHFDQTNPPHEPILQLDKNEDQGLFLKDALVLIDNFFRTVSGISDIRSYITIFRSEESPLYTLKEQKLILTPATPLIKYLITEMMKSGLTVLYNDTQSKSPDNLGKATGASWLISPLMSNNQVIGAILIQGTKGGPNFSESDKQILVSLIEPISNLFQNVFLLQATRDALQNQSQEVITISKVQQDLARLTDRLLETLDVDLVMQTSVMELREMFDLAEVEIQLIAEQS